MGWITDQIAIGNYLDAAALPAGVDALLYLKADCCDEVREDVEVLCIPLIDGPGIDPRDVREAVRFIADVVVAGERILVRCHAGRSRSVAVVGRLRIPRHSAICSTNIRPAIPPAFGHPFHGHSAGAVGAERRRRVIVTRRVWSASTSGHGVCASTRL